MSVGGDLELGSSVDGWGTSLWNVNALSNLSVVGGRLEIAYNNNLQNLDGMLGIIQVGEELQITNNPALQNIDGLANLVSVGEFGSNTGSL